jgi:hypothetical protein
MVNLCVFQVKLFLFKQMLLSNPFHFHGLGYEWWEWGIYQVMQHLKHLVLTVFFVYIRCCEIVIC